MEERLLRLEEKIAYFERHVAEQDRAMLELTDQVARLRQALLTMRERLPDSPAGGESTPEDDRPPHY
jgi:SlyX protein